MTKEKRWYQLGKHIKTISTVTLPSTLTIAGTVSDDGQPTPPALTITWSQTSGPGAIGSGGGVVISATGTAGTTEGNDGIAPGAAAVPILLICGAPAPSSVPVAMLL